MWILILLICSLPVSGALWAEKYVTGVGGRAVTIDCHYEAKYRSHTKYWCEGQRRQCTVLVETKGQPRRNGRVSITDNPKRRIFTVTMKDLYSRDTGWYSCGIIRPGNNLKFGVHLEVSDESRYISETPVRAPMWTSPPEPYVMDAMRTSPSETSAVESLRSSPSETSVTDSMRSSPSETSVIESMRSSPSETSVTDSMRSSPSETPVMDSMTSSLSETSVIESMRSSPSETSVTDSTRIPHFEISEIRFNDTQRKNIQSIFAKSYMIWKVGRWLFFALLGIWTITVTLFTRDRKRLDQSDLSQRPGQ